ncbi:MAG: hypothetical protein NVS3B12_16120 [Acidimicrobiales bacterium]
MTSLLGCIVVSATFGAVTGTTLAWSTTILGVAALVSYSCALLRIERVAAEREMTNAFAPAPLTGPVPLWPPMDLLNSSVDEAPMTASGRPGGRRTRLLDRWAVSHFVWASLAGLLLELVAVITDLVLGNPATPGGRRRNWLDRSESLQRYLRQQSHRALSASATATAGVVVVGTMSGPTTAAYASVSATATSTNPALAVAATQTVAAGAGVAARPEVAFPTYRVVAGDTLGAIAERHGATTDTLTSLNGLGDPNRIWPGQLLRLPAESRTPRPSPLSGYVVAAGDTLGAIARRLGTTVAALATGNRIANPDLILAGQVLRLPTGGDPVMAHPASAPQPMVTGPATRPGTTPAPRRGPVPPPSPAHAVSPPHPVAPAPPRAAAPPPTRPPVTPPPRTVVVMRAPQPPPPPPTPQVSSPLPTGYLRDGFVDQGVDYDAPGGTPLYAIGPGVITNEGINGFGPWAPVLHITGGPLAGRDVYYGHAGPDLVSVGDIVRQGQQISSVGEGIVGYSTGPHLEIGFYPPGGTGAGIEMLWVLNQLNPT